MSKYIDTEKLKTTLETRIANGLDGYGGNLRWLLKTIDSLQHEQQEVDLEKEIDNYLSCSEDIEECADNEHYYVTKSALLSMARYFFIHGCLNARKEE